MNNKEMIKNLCDLIHLDIDAAGAYNQAMDNVDDTKICDMLSSFRSDHLQHIEDLSNVVRQAGGVPPKFSPDLKGYFIEGFTAIRSMTGTVGALKAMRINENLTTRTYNKALNWELPTEARKIVEKNYRDEQRHLNYIEGTLRRMERDSEDFRSDDIDLNQPRV